MVFMEQAMAITANSYSEPLKIRVFTNGTVFANEETVELEKLEKLIIETKSANGVVWYFRENPTTPEPPEIAVLVLDLIIKHRLPLCLSPTEDFANCKDQ